MSQAIGRALRLAHASEALARASGVALEPHVADRFVAERRRPSLVAAIAPLAGAVAGCVPFGAAVVSSSVNAAVGDALNDALREVIADRGAAADLQEVLARHRDDVAAAAALGAAPDPGLRAAAAALLRAGQL